MNIFCTGCQKDVKARLTDGAEIYPHRKDLRSLPFWRCDTCGNYVGCHHKTAEPTRPLGIIPTPELRKERGRIHQVLDPIWKNRWMKRGAVYDAIATRLGQTGYHTADIRNVEDARAAYRAVIELRKEIGRPL